MTTKYKGARFGTLTVEDGFSQQTQAGNYISMFDLVCDCGKRYSTRVDNILSAKNPTCKNCRKTAQHKASAEGYKHPLYSTWRGMLDRCHNPDAAGYRLYGARGITVCAAWRGDISDGQLGVMGGFLQFTSDMGDRPPGYSIDRIDNDEGYYPGNCRWATQEEQSNNTRSNNRVTAGGKTLTTSQWGRVFGTGISWVQCAKNFGVALPVAAELLLNRTETGRVDWESLFNSVGCLSETEKLRRREYFKNRTNTTLARRKNERESTAILEFDSFLEAVDNLQI